jgi:hypothetical protein
MQRVREFILTPEGQTIWAALNDVWLQIAAMAFVMMYVVRDVAS